MRSWLKCFAKARLRGPAVLFARNAALLLVICFLAPPAVAQPTPFGSEGDLREQLQPQWWRREKALFAMGGLSLIGAQWRAAASARLELVTRPVTMRLIGTLRAGPLGRYAPDVDEPYDILRLVDFARYNAPQSRPIHLRVGLLDGMRLGIGHVVNFYSTSVAWDRRTVGAEFSYGGRALTIAAFTGDVLLGGIAGGRVTAHPLFFSRGLSARTTQLGVNYVIDRAPNARLEAYSADLQVELFATGGVGFAPYLSYAWYPDYGDGLAFGADLHAAEFLDLVTFRLRIGVFYNSRQFIPGYVGSLYSVHNVHARILKASGNGVAGVPIQESRGANDLLTEFKLEVAPSFSLWYYYRRHFGSQALSEFHFRLFVQSGSRLRFEVGIDKLGTAGFLGIFEDFDDQSALVFGTDYRILGPFYLHVLARYSFELVARVDAPRYLVQRRFEPFAGVRLLF